MKTAMGTSATYENLNYNWGFPGGSGTFLVTQLVKNPPAMQETLVQSPGQEDPVEKG